MYEKFFGLKENPFSIAPDPRYLYMSEKHRDALAHLLYGIEREGGVVVLTGEVGTGKTTLCRYFLQKIPDNVELAFILHPRLTARELLSAICDEFGIVVTETFNTKSLVDAIHDFLLKKHAQGVHLALLIDEAQNLAPDVLEQLRLLTNLETDRKKLLQIILLGQPELRDLLARENLRQLAQRVTARYHLDALSRVDVKAYVSYRLSVAGCSRPIFTDAALKKVYQLSGGIPRLINLIADRALLGAYSEHQDKVTPDLVKQASKEVGFLAFQEKPPFWKQETVLWNAAFGGMIVGSLVLIAVALSMKHRQPLAPPAVAEAARLAVGDHTADAVTGADPVNAAETEPAAATPIESPTEESGGDIDARTMNDNPGTDSASAAAIMQADAPSGLLSESELTLHDQDTLERVAAARLGRYKPRDENTYRAYRSLMQAWSVSPLPSASELACQYVELRGLRCLHREGNWRGVIQLDRPVILRLLNDEGVAFHATLLELSASGEARLELDGRELITDLGELDQRWDGDYSLLYRLPPYESPVIKPGAIQDQAAWLNQQLDTVREQLLRSGKSRIDDLPAYDASLKDRVRWFQALAGLEQDGVAGALTLINLNSWVGEGVPRLTRPTKQGG